MSASTVLTVRGLNSKPSGPTRVPASASNLSLGYLRAFITLLVVAQHAVMTALALLLLPRWAEFLGRVSTGANRRPILLFGIMIALSGAAYVPVAVGRVLHQVYFVRGIGIGAYGLERGFLARDTKLARRWWPWCVASLVAFVVATGVGIAAMILHLGSPAREIASDSTVALSSAASSFRLSGAVGSLGRKAPACL